MFTNPHGCDVQRNNRKIIEKNKSFVSATVANLNSFLITYHGKKRNFLLLPDNTYYTFANVEAHRTQCLTTKCFGQLKQVFYDFYY